MGLSNRQKFILSSDSARQLLFAHIYDMAQQSFERSMPVYGPFLSESEQSELFLKKSLLPCPFTLWGGFEDAERKMIAFIPEYTSADFPLGAIRITTNFISRLTHRDFLGALLSLGIKREKCGDIIINDSCCSVILHRDIARFVCDNLFRVGKEGVTVTSIDIDSLVLPERKFTKISGTVAALRLDAAVALFLKSGRNEAKEYIASGRLFVNGIIASKSDMRLSGGETVSVRGKGKGVISVNGQSKKGRIFITIGKYV